MTEDKAQFCNFCLNNGQNVVCEKCEMIPSKFESALYFWGTSADHKTEPEDGEDYLRGYQDGYNARGVLDRARVEIHIDKPRGYTLNADTNDAWKPKDEPQTEERLKRLQACIDCEHTDMCEWCYTRWSKDEPQKMCHWDKSCYVQQPNEKTCGVCKQWYEDEPQTEREVSDEH